MIFNVGSSSGSAGKLVHLLITTDNTIAGATITATNGSEVYTATAPSGGGVVKINGSALGEWTIKENVNNTQVTVTAVYYGNYEAILGGDIATLNIITEDEELKNATVKIYKGTDTTGTLLKSVTLVNGFVSADIIFSKSDKLPCDFYIYEKTNNIGETVKVTEFKEYTVKLSIMTSVVLISNGAFPVPEGIAHTEANATVGKSGNYMSITPTVGGSGNAKGGKVAWEIDFSKINTIKVESAYAAPASWACIGISDTNYNDDVIPSNMSWAFNLTSNKYQELPLNASGAKDFVFDVSNLTGKHHLVVVGYKASAVSTAYIKGLSVEV